ncbi:MAG TPA: M28 family metallopeptidase, partial [Candidatus Polarisedimenticolia bacterium]
MLAREKPRPSGNNRSQTGWSVPVRGTARFGSLFLRIGAAALAIGATALATGTPALATDAAGMATGAEPVVRDSDGSGPRPRLGFFAGLRAAEARAEGVMLATPTPERERAWLRALTEEPHVAGTPEDRKTAEYVRDRLAELGLKTEMVSYDVLLNYPKSVSLRLLKPEPADLSLREAGVRRDKDSFSETAFPAFHGYGASGKAAGQVVYVNYGTREDFERLESMGLSVDGRIALVRYGKVFRGLKVKEAQARGAKGVLIYSDPEDDGYMKGDTFPDGPMRPASSLQRGSVQFLSSGPGDPTTPGYASTKGARRLAREQAEGIPKIPSLPISWGEAQKILSALAGRRVPDDWQGGLPFAYHFGPGPAEIEMNVEMDYALRPIWNVMATIPGAVEPDREVILGNHRDAWTYGAVDPNSGTASLLETARALAAALKSGWKPRRTIRLASWDAEEYGLVGSTEWVEDRFAALQENAVAYVNLDVAVTGGDLDVDGVPSLRDLVIEAAGDLADPRHGGTILDTWRSRKEQEWAKSEPACGADEEARFTLGLNPLGSGSDYTAFLDHAGVASLNFTFEGDYGVYHSIYDDLFWMENFGDPEFLYHVVASRLYGLLAMRLAAAEIVPIRYGAYGRALTRELELLRRDSLRDRRAFAAATAGGVSIEPGSSAAVEAHKRPALSPDFGPLAKAIAALGDEGDALDAALHRIEEQPDEERRKSSAVAAPTLARLNDDLVQVERAFLSSQGLPGRAWFRHSLYAPGLTTGYASWPFPGIAQAIKERNPEMLEAQMRILVERIGAG